MDAASLMARAAELTQRAAELLASGQVSETEAADREAHALRQRALRQARKARASVGQGPYAPAKSEREIVVQSLTELDAISFVRLVSDYVAARFSRSVAPRLFSALRRNEKRTWERGSSLRVAFVVPALEGPYFTQARCSAYRSVVWIFRWPVGPPNMREWRGAAVWVRITAPGAVAQGR